MQRVGKRLCRFSSCATDVMAERDLLKKSSYVSGLDYLQMLVGRVSLLADYCLCGVEDSDAM